ncbi:MAG: hypothetical protein COW04_10030 [Deltaproteobacteria bacterium CG12_big_fil_rev_8_21_14_0_65_43_10]|nr:MAG: hypothetical protein AUK23_06400 [Deltaproteobacteria bacterium CG2_30_43_15]PIQ44989.1 MAG: hypothetical protein COW04_10030 [Deltaproteobacteria bacterium CG12_big_fil_rev_8_21_14_0_65_43_10]PIU86492.1 MAG: hypothetical protein COS67_02290 [Deltaproteobacteria bacterium CG06_land_8_20_14_3_00_44_19]PIX23642.1 MAG: hypothetical protein COZ68_08745 [Deltaproteobacteria bacterium CG_4_8_14_3_um_filter_43_13]PIZ20702.1 MAG: hypothetical protein COY50_03440 [Deltaproteobacteria bacterium C
MADLSSFEQLEGRIDKLIKQSTFLKEQNKILSENLNQKDQDIQKLTDNIDDLQKERTLVFNKVVDLIDKLEDI